MDCVCKDPTRTKWHFKILSGYESWAGTLLNSFSTVLGTHTHTQLLGLYSRILSMLLEFKPKALCMIDSCFTISAVLRCPVCQPTYLSICCSIVFETVLLCRTFSLPTAVWDYRLVPLCSTFNIFLYVESGQCR